VPDTPAENTPDDARVELLAEAAHVAWSGWMDYLFSKCAMNPDKSATIPAGLVARWQRQASTPYCDLPEREKESDRVEARRYLGALGGQRS
jgi:hypothetical protein